MCRNFCESLRIPSYWVKYRECFSRSLHHTNTKRFCKVKEHHPFHPFPWLWECNGTCTRKIDEKQRCASYISALVENCSVGRIEAKYSNFSKLLYLRSCTCKLNCYKFGNVDALKVVVDADFLLLS